MKEEALAPALFLNFKAPWVFPFDLQLKFPICVRVPYWKVTGAERDTQVSYGHCIDLFCFTKILC